MCNGALSVPCDWSLRSASRSLGWYASLFLGGYDVAALISKGGSGAPQYVTAGPTATTPAPSSVMAVEPGMNPAHPRGPALSQDEADAVNNHDAGKPYDRKAYNSALQKIKTGEKLANERRNRPGKDKKS